MRNLKTLALLFGIVFFGTKNTYGQTTPKTEETETTTIADVPEPVQQVLKNYSGYQIDNQAVLNKKNNSTVYKFKLQKGIWVDYLLIDEKGKVLGIESGEGER